MTYAGFSFLDAFPFRNKEDRLFVTDMCEKFTRVRQGFERFSRVEPDQWLKESVLAIHEQIRSGWHRIGVPLNKVQKVADHEACGMSLAFLMATKPEYNPDRIRRMFAVHDIAEGLIGDFTPADPITKPEKFRLEKIVIDFLVSNHPSLIEADEMKALWQEFEDGMTADAQLANDIDGLEMVMHAQVYERQYPALKEKLTEFWSYTERKLKTEEGKALFSELNRNRQTPHPLKAQKHQVFTFPWDL